MCNKNINDNSKKDKGLIGNEKIEEAIFDLQKNPNEEEVAHTLTVIRHRMKEGGQFIVAVEPPTGGNQMQIQAVQTPDGNSWWAAFTSFEEELKGSGSVMSTFLTGIEQAFRAVLAAEGAKGIIVNPWNRTIMLDKNLIRIILGEPA